MEQILNEFYNFLIHTKHMKENTVASYRRDIGAFLSYGYERGHRECREICDDFSSYLEHLQACNRSASTVSRNIASLRCLFRYLVAQKLLEYYPSKGKKYEKTDKKAVQYDELLTTDEVDRLISAAKTEDVKGYRDCAILETLYATGLKVSDFLNIRISSLHLQEGYLTVEADGQNRYVPLYKGALTAIRNYLKHSRKYLLHDEKTDYLFLNQNGQPLSRQGLWKILKIYAQKAGINKEITPHLFRRSMAMHLVENGADIATVQELLGHKSVHLTKSYVENFKPKILSAYGKFHPKSR